MSERENYITGLQLPVPGECSITICKAEPSDEDEVLKTHIMETKVEGKPDVCIKLLSVTTVKEEFSRGEIFETHESLNPVKEEPLDDHHCGISASNDIFGAEEVTHLQIEDNESLDLRIFENYLEDEIQIKKHSSGVEGSIKNEEDSEVNLRIEEEKSITRNSTSLHSTNIQDYKRSNSRSCALTKLNTRNMGPIKFSCNNCNTVCSSYSNLKDHKKMHTGETLYSCKICNKGFTFYSQFKVHQRVHTGETPFMCNICNKSFSRSGNLNVHKRTHMGVTPFTCNICNKSFSQSAHLIVHKRTHTGETPFTCNICNKSCSCSASINVHMRTHTGETPFTCRICKKSFSQSSSINVHMRTHTGETPFTCSICNKSFSQSSSLNAHMRTHTGETPFTCNICNKSFSQSSNLNAHKRIHTRETTFT